MNSSYSKTAGASRNLIMFLGVFLVLITVCAFLNPLITNGQAPGVQRTGESLFEQDSRDLKNSNFSIFSPITWFVGNGIKSVLFGVSYAIGVFASLLLTVAVWLIDFALSLNSQVFQLAAVHIGWRILRDFANLGFVLGIIVMAFSTILRSQTYGVKQILWKFILMAVLINFSLSIAGVFLDSAGIITDFFISRSTNGSSLSFASALSNAFGPQRLWDTQRNFSAAGEIADDLAKGVSSLFFVIIFSWIAVLSFFTFAVMLFYRFAIILFLLITAPVAWFAWIFPKISAGQGSLWDLWWNQFIRWVFFAPIVSFFMYLAILMMQTRAQLNIAIADNQLTVDQIISGSAGANTAQAIQGAILIGGSQTFVSMIGEMSVFIALMMGGLFVANKMGIWGADTGMKWSKFGVQMFTTGIGKATARGVGGYARRQATTFGYKKDEATGQTTTAAQRLAARLNTLPLSIPGLNKIMPQTLGISEAVAKAAEANKKELETFQKERYAKMSDRELIRIVNTLGPTSDPVKAAGAAMEVAKRGIWNKQEIGTGGTQIALISKAAKMQMLEAAKRTKAEKDIIAYNPHLAKEIYANDAEAEKKIIEAIRGISPEKAKEWNEEAFGTENDQAKHPEVVLNMSVSNVNKIATENPELAAKMVEAFRKLPTATAADQTKYNTLKKTIYTNPNLQHLLKNEEQAEGERLKKGPRSRGGPSGNNPAILNPHGRPITQ